ncbi:hypothetical protein JG687_00010627 [Phytophthora cactorum]|uniref:Necrosis inducing protein n=1 Tax=Phytophthora cactorum TaxID=29920 RepID=A0A329S4D1_9STRA|nr:hypothetical protein Pcac1_g15602 [Phytophthora cactorum]KAG2806741.1 hypothetical protein PC112_g17716 [Phytophthora cactorum]KAG2808202.1 hypothetical protein PC111_g16600 [Phytophthora cactorum]KAG2828747.1 hypothetical protein PC113_g21409 [Phytophthora cactorum]KAG2886244.1 hypothetical protein PC114_g19355 [Phytophthora cactorum]
METLQKLLLAMTVMTSALSLCLSTELRLFPAQSSTSHRRYKKFTFSGIQICYSLDSCYNNIAVSAAWRNAPHGTRFAFYQGSGCSGEYLRMQDIVATGSVDFTRVNFANKVSSFMLLETSNYATAGMKEICQDEDTMLAEAASNGSFQI